MKNADKPINPEYYSNWNSNCQLQELVIDNESKGLSKREYFAGLAMSGLINNVNSSIHIAKAAVKLADALLEELETTQK